jgi:hypothetical protein
MRGNDSRVRLRRKIEENLRGKLARNNQCTEMSFVRRLGIGKGK